MLERALSAFLMEFWTFLNLSDPEPRPPGPKRLIKLFWPWYSAINYKRKSYKKIQDSKDITYHNESTIYRPGQPNWQYTMWKFQDISVIQILHEINFGHFEAPKTAILPIWAALSFEFLDVFDISKCEIPKNWKFKASKITKMTVFDPLKSAKIDYT